MNDQQLLQRLISNGGKLEVLMQDRPKAKSAVNNLVRLFARASNLASQAKIAEIRINFSDLDRWSSKDLDYVVRETQKRIDQITDPKNPKRTMKMGFWYEKKDSYMFRIYEKRLDGLGPAAE